MRFPPTVLDQIRDGVSISDVVGRYVTWDKRKTNRARRDFWACCPFHPERTPSFHVDDRKGIYHCFGCGVTGDHFRFLTEKQGRTFPEAVEEVASIGGMTIPASTPESREAAAKRMSLVQANETATAWFQDQLQRTPEAMAYLAGRGITPDEIGAYRLGWAPDGNALLRAKLGDVDDLVTAGIVGRTDGRTYDWFRGRVMFPILDAKGQSVGFSGRAMGDGEPKYLNTPETPIFSKGSLLYNGATARKQAWEGVPFVLVEGNIDAIANGRVGMVGAAPMGTALTEAHVKLMAKATETATLAFDGDPAGRKAASKAIDLILPEVGPTFTARFAQLPDGQDPDSLIKRNPASYQTAIANAVSLGDMLWKRETVGISPAIPEHRAKLEGNLRKALELIRDKDTRRAYGAEFKDRLAALGERPKVYRSNSYSGHSTSPSAGRLLQGYRRTAGLSLKEAILVGAIAAAPQGALDLAEGLVSNDGLSPEATALVSKLVGALVDSPDGAIREVLEVAGLTDVVDDALAKANAAGVALELGSEGAAALGVLRGTAVH